MLERWIEAWFRGPTLDNWPWAVGAVLVFALAYVVQKEFVKIAESEQAREEEVDDEQGLA
ncbi:hypothetical protein ES708_30352 [subsurface metagenome]